MSIQAATAIASQPFTSGVGERNQSTAEITHLDKRDRISQSLKPRAENHY
jgi:hypothetical protein